MTRLPLISFLALFKESSEISWYSCFSLSANSSGGGYRSFLNLMNARITFLASGHRHSILFASSIPLSAQLIASLIALLPSGIFKVGLPNAEVRRLLAATRSIGLVEPSAGDFWDVFRLGTFPLGWLCLSRLPFFFLSRMGGVLGCFLFAMILL